MDEHRRRRIRFWLCRCGKRYPCSAAVYYAEVARGGVL